QVLYNGGIPRDIYGDYIWKYYNATLNNGNNYIGRSSSWTGVSYFYEYAKNNTGYGLVADVDVNLYYAEPGDIIQVGDEDVFVHTVVVYDTITNNNQVVDILVNSNTNDYENVPISSIFVSEIRLIKIIGWNE
ncbi:MAG: amidase domain-containing protein, partial [Bacilli bacterium]|nr:amidase domain-containing protein [Bacilli bacterium]